MQVSCRLNRPATVQLTKESRKHWSFGLRATDSKFLFCGGAPRQRREYDGQPL